MGFEAQGILLFGHGARDSEWARPFRRIRETIKEMMPGTLVEMGFLELMAPDFNAAVDTLVSGGATRVVVVPVFIAIGGHVGRDLPRIAAEAMERHPGLHIDVVPPVGMSDPVLAAMATYALSSLYPSPRFEGA